jgi:hypothetical protein
MPRGRTESGSSATRGSTGSIAAHRRRSLADPIEGRERSCCSIPAPRVVSSRALKRRLWGLRLEDPPHILLHRMNRLALRIPK